MNLELLKKTFKGDLETSPETLEKYSQDASLFQLYPKLVVFPRDSADVCALVKWVNTQDEKLSITPRSAGTCMSGGAINESIIMDFTRYMNHLGEVNVDEKTLVT